MTSPLVPHPAPLPSDAPLSAVLNRLDTWYAQHAPAIYATLRPGATNIELDALEAHIGHKLPADFRALYRWHDGQDWSVGGVFGLDWMPLAEVGTNWQMWADIARENSDMNVSIRPLSYPTGAIRELYTSAVWVPFLHDGGGNHVALDLGPDVAGGPGQVMTTGRDEEHRYVLASSVEGFLREYLRRLETGQVVVQALDGFEDEMWHVGLLNGSGNNRETYHQLGNLFPGFGAVLGTPDLNTCPDTALPLAEALRRLDTVLAEQHPDLLAALPPGASEAELDAAEARLGRPLPPEVRLWYSQHRDWGQLFRLRSIPLDELGMADPATFGTPDAPGAVEPFSSYGKPSTAADWLPLWEDGVGGYVGLNLANYGEVRTFGASVRPRHVLAERLDGLLHRYVRFAEASLLIRDGSSLRVPDVKGQTGTGAVAAFPGFGVAPAQLNLSAP